MDPIQLYNLGSGKSLGTNLVAYYKLDSSLVDSTGLSPTGATGFGSPGYVSGITGNAVNFPSNSRLDFADNNNFSFTNGTTDVPFSISLWAYFTTFSATSNFLINKRDASTSDNEWQITYIPGTGILLLKMIPSASAYQGITSSATISLNTWYHIVCTDNGTLTNAGMKMYINNVLQTGSNFNTGVYTGMINGASTMAMGQTAWAGAPGTAHIGNIEDVGIWKNRVLVSSNVSKLYNGGSGLTYPF